MYYLHINYCACFCTVVHTAKLNPTSFKSKYLEEADSTSL